MTVVLCLMAGASVVSGQPFFVDKTRNHKYHLPTRSVLPGGAGDINGDLVDDLMILDKGNVLKVLVSSGKSLGLTLADTLRTGSVREWTLTAGDLDNNGTTEVLTAGEYNAASIFGLSGGTLTRKPLAAGVYAQGSNTADIDNDGWLDYYLSNDLGPNRIYLNNRAGSLVASQIIDFLHNDPTDGSGNYGSEWADVNNDLLPDLYISKCRAGVTDPADPRRVNRLYINYGNGHLIEEAKKYNLDIGAQTWTSTFGDLDNDGDQDVIVINHYEPHMLLRNDGPGGFVRVILPKPLQTFAFQALMRDFDNDGLLDILLAGVEGALMLHNRGNFEFSLHDDLFGSGAVRSLVAGDFNDDGFTDVHAHMGEPINDIGYTDDQLWVNQSNGNRYLKVSLEGTTSNRSGIGARIELYGAWGRQLRYVKGGESYGIFSSLQQVFGMGGSEVADSLVVLWPSGKKDTYTAGLVAGKTLLVQEGRCMSVCPAISDTVLIHTGQQVTIGAPAGFVSYVWNSGQTTQSIKAGPGSWYVRMQDAAGCITISKPVEVVSGCFGQGAKILQAENEVKACGGSMVELTCLPAAAYSWSTGETTPAIRVTENSIITVTATDHCGRTLRDTAEVKFFDVLPETRGDSIKKGETATLVSSLATTEWYLEGQPGIVLHTGDTLITQSLDTTTFFVAVAKDIIDKKTAFAGIKTPPVSNPYGANSTLGHLVFNVERKCIIRSVVVSTDTEGWRRILILNKAQDTIFRKDIYLSAGTTRVSLNVPLNPGMQYVMATDESVNLESLGYRSPRLVRTYLNTNFPYTAGGVVTISTSSLGPTYYFYFYDWEVDYDLVICTSPPVRVAAIVDTSTGSDDLYDANIRVFPNPATDHLTIQADGTALLSQVKLTDLTGRIVETTESNRLIANGCRVNLQGLSPGTYLVYITTADGRKYCKRIIRI